MDLFALRSGGRTGLHPTVYSFEMHVSEKIASRSSSELHNTKSPLYLLKYVLETFIFSWWGISLSSNWCSNWLAGWLLNNECQLVTGRATKPWPREICFSKYKNVQNGWSNFSENLRIVALKLPEFTRFLSPNPSIYTDLPY